MQGLYRKKVEAFQLQFILHPNYYSRFSETEGVAAITTLLSQYKVSLRDEEKYRPLPGETPEQRRSRIIKSDPLFTLTYVLSLFDCLNYTYCFDTVQVLFRLSSQGAECYLRLVGSFWYSGIEFIIFEDGLYSFISSICDIHWRKQVHNNFWNALPVSGPREVKWPEIWITCVFLPLQPSSHNCEPVRANGPCESSVCHTSLYSHQFEYFTWNVRWSAPVLSRLGSRSLSLTSTSTNLAIRCHSFWSNSSIFSGRVSLVACFAY